MPVFQYIALDSQGVEIKDEIEALSEKEAISKIRNLGYFPTKVRSKAAGKTAAKVAARPKKRRGAGASVKTKNITQFARQLSTLQDAGLPILRSLRILQEQQKAGAFKRIVGYVADDIEGGSTLSEAMGHYHRAFDRLFVNMVAAGEAGGVLDLILSRVADFKEKAIRMRGRVKSAMIYPIVVLSAAFLILLGLMKYVIPLGGVLDSAGLDEVRDSVVQDRAGRDGRGRAKPGNADGAGHQCVDRLRLRLGRALRRPVWDRRPAEARSNGQAGPLRPRHRQIETARGRSAHQQSLHLQLDPNAGHPDQRRRADPGRAERYS
jgi:hypothetical protein